MFGAADRFKLPNERIQSGRFFHCKRALLYRIERIWLMKKWSGNQKREKPVSAKKKTMLGARKSPVGAGCCFTLVSMTAPGTTSIQAGRRSPAGAVAILPTFERD